MFIVEIWAYCGRLNIFGIRICRRLVAKSGQAEILEILFWTGISETLAKTLGGDEDYVQGWM